MDLTIRQKTVFEVNGKIFDEAVSAQNYAQLKRIERLLDESEDLYFNSESSDTEDIAQYLIAHKDQFIELLGEIL